ncbi:MAG: hypothetical protein KC656_33230, partial [Myxococcales bacterium]|nr:hypothetical protein [Myxococcales bacterium]
APVSRAAQTATGVASETLRTHDGPVLGLAASPEGLWTWTADATFLAGRRMGPAPPAGAVPLVDGPPVWLLRDGEHVEAVDLEGQRRPTGVAVRELVPDGSLVLALCGGTLARLRVRHVGGDRVVVAVPLATIQPACTVLFRGCAVTAGPHGTWLHRATAAGVEQVRVRALDDAVVVDAHSGERATVVVARRPSGLVRLVVADGTVTEAATDDPTAILVELPGVLLVQDGGTLHLRDARTPHAPGRSVQAALPPGVVAHAGRPTAAEGPAVLTFSLRGPHDA